MDYKEELERMILPDGILEIGDEAFAGCKNLRMISLPENACVEIGEGAFDGCMCDLSVRG